MELEQTNTIKEAIVETIAFFDLFQYPLTSWEIWLYGLWKEDAVSYNNVLAILDSSMLADKVSSSNGFYFLPGRENIIKTRMERYNYSDKKFKRALLISYFFKFIPWIKMIAVSNIIGSHNLKKQSDIDIFIIAAKNKVWLTRLFSTGLMKVFKQRPTPEKEKDKICLNFYLSEDSVNMKKYLLNGVDIYFIYWLACLTPIYNKDKTYEKLIKENDWLNKYLANWQQLKISQKRKNKASQFGLYYEIVDLLIGGLENNAINFQIKKMPSSIKKLINQDSRVVVNRQVLKLHLKDRRVEYKQKWQQRLIDIKLKHWLLR